MDNIFSKNIKNLRVASGYSESLVAMVLGIETEIYRDCESGISELSYALIEKLAILYDCDSFVIYDDNLDAKSIAKNTRIKVNDVPSTDILEIMNFKDIVNTYLNMDKMLVD